MQGEVRLESVGYMAVVNVSIDLIAGYNSSTDRQGLALSSGHNSDMLCMRRESFPQSCLIAVRASTGVVAAAVQRLDEIVVTTIDLARALWAHPICGVPRN